MHHLVAGVVLAGLNLSIPASRCWDLALIDIGIPQTFPVFWETADTLPHALLPRAVKLSDDNTAGLWGYPHKASWREADASFLIEPTQGASPRWSLRITLGDGAGEAIFTIEASESGPRSFRLRATSADCAWYLPIEPGYLEWLSLEPRDTPYTVPPHLIDPEGVEKMLLDRSIQRGASDIPGSVRVLALIRSNGTVLRAEIERSSGNVILDEIAREVVGASTFVPARFGQVAVSTWSPVFLSFARRD